MKSLPELSFCFVSEDSDGFFDSCQIDATSSYENVVNIGSYIKILEQNSNKYMNVKSKSRSVLHLVRQTIVLYAIVKHQHKVTE